MAELTIRPEEIRSALNEFAESYKPAEVAAEEVGHVVFAADGIAHVRACPASWPTSCSPSRTAPRAWP